MSDNADGLIDAAAEQAVSEMFDPTQRSPFAEVFKVAYGWTLDNEGYLAGLVAGDMGYESTDMLWSDLFTNAQVAEDKALFARGQFPCRWPVSEATAAFVEACATALGIEKTATQEERA